MSTSAYTVSETSTEGLAGSDGAELWREHVCFNHGGLGFAFDRPRDFTGSTIVQRAGDHQLVDFCSDAIAYSRSERQARDDEHLQRIVLPRRGTVTVVGARTARSVAPGTGVTLPRGGTFTLRHDSGARAWILTVPVLAGVRARANAGAEPVALDLQTGPGAIAADIVRSLSQQRATLGHADFAGLADQVAVLLRHGTVPADDLAAAARSVARRRAGDHALTPASLAHDLGWSLRRLQTSLRRAGTSPAEVIRDARLDAAWHALRTSDLPIAAIAFDCGFGSLSAFGDAFRRRYGLTPRETRTDGAHACPPLR